MWGLHPHFGPQRTYRLLSGLEDLGGLLLRAFLLIALPLQVSWQHLLQDVGVGSTPPGGPAEDLTRRRLIQEH